MVREMNLSASQCSSSGCESGWTSYLDQSSLSKNQCHSFVGIGNEGARVVNEEEEEGDDLSMVSDASSGPRHYCEDDEDCFDENGYFYSPHLASELAQKSKKKKKIKEQVRNQQHSSYLDDTASSPVLGYAKKNISYTRNEASTELVLDFSQGFSATQIKGKSTLKRHFGFLKSSLGGKPAAGKNGGFKDE